MDQSGEGTTELARATAALTAAARHQRDRKLQQALIELAGLCDAYDRAGTPGGADAERILAKSRALVHSAGLVGSEEAGAAASLAQTIIVSNRSAARSPGIVSGTTGGLGRRTGSDWIGQGPPPMIVVADDDPDVRRLLTHRLTGAGYRVQTAEDGEEAFALAKRERPALVVCDLGMPLVPGEMLILALRTDPETESIPIAVITGDPGRLGPEHRVDAILTKPVQVVDLLETILRLLKSPARSGN